MSTNTGTPTASLTANNSAGEDSTTNKSGRSSFARLSSGLDLPASQKALQRRASFSVRQQMPNFKFSDALEKAENGGGEEHDSLEDLRLRTKKFMTHSVVGHYYEDIMLVISVISTFEFIFETYLEPANKFNNEAQSHLHKVDFFFGAAFAFDWCLNFLLADRKYQFVLSFFAMVDMMTVVSIFGTFGHQEPAYDEVASAISVVMYMLFLLKTTRVLRSLRVMNKLDYIEDAVDRFIGVISLSISVMILFFASVMQFLEKSTLPYPFHTWMYYIWVTISTVGYGDITPITPVGRFAAMAMIGFAIISVPKMTNELIEKMNLQSVYARAVYNPKSKSSRHIVICGDLSSTSLADFFEELFHEDHDNADLNAVILLPSPPTVEIILMMQNPKYVLSLSYLEGSALVDLDLKRAKAEIAEAVFIMTNKFSTVPDEEDAKAILQNLSIKRYVSFFSYSVYNTLYCMQLIRPENLRQLSKSDVREVDTNNLVVCLNEIKMGVLAKAVVYPGVNTFIMNLITSFSEDAFQSPEERGDEHSGVDGDGESGKSGNFSPNAWLGEYQKGCDWEIYTTTLSDIFVGAKFSELSLALYDKLGVVLFALQLTDKRSGQSKMFLSPSEFLIPDKSEFRIEAFVMAKNKASSDLSFSGKGGHHDAASAFSVMGDSLHSIASVMKGPDRRRSSVVMISGGSKANSVNHNMHKSPSSNSPVGMGDGGLGAFTRTGATLLSHLTHLNSKEPSSSNVKEPHVKKKTSRWKALKRSALLEKKVQSFSYQEILQRMEDEHLNKNYYLRPTAVELVDVTIRIGVIEEVPFINNHIIVIGKELSNLYDLIRPLRAKYLGSLKYIVILYPYDIPYDVWQRISMFDAILIVRGSPLEETNLRRAGIFRAQQVVVLADGARDGSVKSSSGMEALVDSDAIFAYQCVKRMNPNTQVVVEIVNQSNIGYLVTDIQGSTDPNDYKFSNQFAAGTLFTTSLLDSLVCQAYYNPHIIKVVNGLINGVDQLERSELSAQAAAQAAETQKSVREGGGNSSEEDEDDDTFDTNGPKVNITSRLSGIKGSCLYQISMPENLADKTYGGLFKHLSAEGIIPLGLLRGTLANLNIGPKSNKMPYVYTNPDRTAELYNCDRIFVLSTKPLQSPQKTSVKDWILDIQMQQNRQKESIAPGIGGHGKSRSNSQTKGIDALEKSHKKLEERLNRLSVDVNKKFSAIMNKLESQERAQKSRFGQSAQEEKEEDDQDDDEDEVVENRSTSTRSVRGQPRSSMLSTGAPTQVYSLNNFDNVNKMRRSDSLVSNYTDDTNNQLSSRSRSHTMEGKVYGNANFDPNDEEQLRSGRERSLSSPSYDPSMSAPGTGRAGGSPRTLRLLNGVATKSGSASPVQSARKSLVASNSVKVLDSVVEEEHKGGDQTTVSSRRSSFAENSRNSGSGKMERKTSFVGVADPKSPFVDLKSATNSGSKSFSGMPVSAETKEAPGLSGKSAHTHLGDVNTHQRPSTAPAQQYSGSHSAAHSDFTGFPGGIAVGSEMDSPKHFAVKSKPVASPRLEGSPYNQIGRKRINVNVSGPSMSLIDAPTSPAVRSGRVRSLSAQRQQQQQFHQQQYIQQQPYQQLQQPPAYQQMYGLQMQSPEDMRNYSPYSDMYGLNHSLTADCNSVSSFDFFGTGSLESAGPQYSLDDRLMPRSVNTSLFSAGGSLHGTPQQTDKKKYNNSSRNDDN